MRRVLAHLNIPHFGKLREDSSSLRRIFVEWPEGGTDQSWGGEKVPLIVGDIEKPKSPKAGLIG